MQLQSSASPDSQAFHPTCWDQLIQRLSRSSKCGDRKDRGRVTLVALRLACMLGLVLRINLRIIIRTFN